MVKKDFLFISRNKSPVKIDLTPQKVKFESVPGKIYPKYVEEIRFDDSINFLWTNTAIKMEPNQLFKACRKFTGEIQNFIIECENEQDVLTSAITTLKTIDGRKFYQSYETKHTYKLNGMIVGQIGYSNKIFIFDLFLISPRLETLFNKKLEMINLIVKSLSFDRLRLTGNIDIDLSHHKIKTFEFRNEMDLRKIFHISKNYNHTISIIDLSDWCLTPNETNCVEITKLASTDVQRTEKILEQLKNPNELIHEFRFFARIDQIDQLIKYLPKCKKFYCLISNQDVRHGSTIKYENFDEKQKTIADYLSDKYKNIDFTFRANKIYDENEPPNYVELDVDSLQDVSIDEMNGTMYPELDDD